MYRPEQSWRVFQLCESLEWKFLPYAGGLLDQPEWLLSDLSTLRWRSQVIQDRVRDMLPKYDAEAGHS